MAPSRRFYPRGGGGGKVRLIERRGDNFSRPLSAARDTIGGMGIIPDNWIDVFAIVWLEWFMFRPAYWSVYGQLADCLVDRDRRTLIPATCRKVRA